MSLQDRDLAPHKVTSRYDMTCSEAIPREIRESGQENPGCATDVSESTEMPNLRRRSRPPAKCVNVVADGQEDILLSRGFSKKASTQGQKVHSFTGCIEKFFSACKINVKMLLRSTCRRAAKSEYQKMPRTFSEPETGSQHAHEKTLSCLSRANRWDVRKIFGDIIKIEEDIAYSVPRSVIYYV